MDYTVDWERRRILPASGQGSACVHGSRLIEWCADCAVDLDVLNDALPPHKDAA